MTVLLWWIPPIAATVAAIAWLSWRARMSQRAETARERDAKLRRMGEALARPIRAEQAAGPRGATTGSGRLLTGPAGAAGPRGATTGSGSAGGPAGSAATPGDAKEGR